MHHQYIVICESTLPEFERVIWSTRITRIYKESWPHCDNIQKWEHAQNETTCRKTEKPKWHI